MRVCIDIDLDERTKKLLDVLGITPEELVYRIVSKYLAVEGGAGEAERGVEEAKEEEPVVDKELEEFCSRHPVCVEYKNMLAVKLPRMVRLYKEGRMSIEEVREGLKLLPKWCKSNEKEHEKIISIIRRAYIYTNVVVNERTGMDYIIVVSLIGSDHIAYSINDCHAWELARGALPDIISQLSQLRELPGIRKRTVGGATIDPILDEVIGKLRKRLNKVLSSRIGVAEAPEPVDKEKMKQERMLVRDALG